MSSDTKVRPASRAFSYDTYAIRSQKEIKEALLAGQLLGGNT